MFSNMCIYVFPKVNANNCFCFHSASVSSSPFVFLRFFAFEQIVFSVTLSLHAVIYFLATIFLPLITLFFANGQTCSMLPSVG